MVIKARQILRELALAQSDAELQQVCRRKAVGCAVVELCGITGVFVPWTHAHNGPSRQGHECTNVVGNCGCSHSEPRAMLDIKALSATAKGKPKLVLLCEYAPCTNCANIVLDSGMICGLVYRRETQHDQRGLEYLRSAMPCLSVAELERFINTDQALPLRPHSYAMADEFTRVLKILEGWM